MNDECDQADVVISTRGRGTLIDVTITSIRQSRHTAFTLWIVDQSDDDATERAVVPHAQADARVRYLRTTSRGVSAGRNEGAAAGTAPYLLFTDDDCRVAPDWLGAMVRELQQEGVWAVFGRVIPDEGFPPEGPDPVQRDKPVSQALPIAFKNAPKREVYEGNRFNLGFGHGANMGLRRLCFEELRGFDELLGAGGPLRSWGDRDLGYRILRRGGRIVYTPEALVYHRHWRDWDAVRRTYRNYAIGTGAAVGKYLRCGDMGGLYLLLEWLLDQGLRQIVSGVLKWRSWPKIQAGLLQLVYPWVGLVQSWRYPVDREQVLYRVER
jgi:GT2 family glycosyltransferase